MNRATVTTAECYVLADLENLVGGPAASEAEFTETCRSLLDAVGIDDRTRTIAAASTFTAFRAFSALDAAGIPAQRLLRDGRDGAELAILDAVDPDELARLGVRRVVIASGDHLFAALARALRERGIRVVLVLGHGMPSWELYVACTESIRLPLAPVAPPIAAPVARHELRPAA